MCSKSDVPWETQIVKLREEFVLRALEQDANVAALCREFAVSRKTGYKWLERFRGGGVAALEDLSRRPMSCPVRASGDSVLAVIELRRRHPSWGPKKLRVVLHRTLVSADVPSVRTIARILDRAGQVTARRRPVPLAQVASSAPQICANGPNETWTIDFKGWWHTNNGERCEPLTVRDAASRFMLCATLARSTATQPIRGLFERAFEQYGLPGCLHMDNGSPFACTRSRAGLTTLSAWWVSLGIRLSRGRPGHPQDNGGHERMHADIARELQLHAADTWELQQAALDQWRHEFNHVRPHEALAQKTPAECYVRSARPFRGQRTVFYDGCEVRRVDKAGAIKYRGSKLRIGDALRGYEIGLLPIDENTVRILFYDLDLGELKISA